MEKISNVKLLVLAAFLCFIESCSFPIEGFDIEYDERPVVHCFFSPDKPFCVHVAKTASAIDTSTQFFNNAFVCILTNNDTVAVLNHTGNGYYENPSARPMPGIVYSLHVRVPGFEKLQASDSIPSLVSEIVYKGAKTNAWIDEEGHLYDGLNFIIHDIEGINYYEFVKRDIRKKFNENTNDTTISISNFFSIDPSVKLNNVWQAVFTDALFDNTSYTIQMLEQSGRHIQYISDPNLEIEAEIIQGSPTFYKYRITYIKHRDAQYADFWDPMEPVIMYSNIENGYGIFAGYHSQKIKIDF